MTYINKKTGKRYTMLCVAGDCTNNNDGRTFAVYVQHSTISRIIKWLMPLSVFVRETEEFDEKFTKIER